MHGRTIRGSVGVFFVGVVLVACAAIMNSPRVVAIGAIAMCAPWLVVLLCVFDTAE